MFLIFLCSLHLSLPPSLCLLLCLQIFSVGSLRAHPLLPSYLPLQRDPLLLIFEIISKMMSFTAPGTPLGLSHAQTALVTAFCWVSDFSPGLWAPAPRPLYFLLCTPLPPFLLPCEFLCCLSLAECFPLFSGFGTGWPHSWVCHWSAGSLWAQAGEPRRTPGPWGHCCSLFPTKNRLSPYPWVGVRPQGGETLEARGTVPGLQETALQQADRLPECEGELARARAQRDTGPWERAAQHPAGGASLPLGIWEDG